MSEIIVILGSGLAGYNFAREFRKQNTDARLVMLTADDGTFYSKPMLSNGVAKNKTAEELAISSADKMATDLSMSVHTHTVAEKLDTENQLVITDSGERFGYDKLVLAMGASSFIPSFEGNAEQDLLSVNNLLDYKKFRQNLADKGNKIAIIGAGLIGCEFANDLCHGDFEVTVIAPSEWPLNNLLPEEAGVFLKQSLAGKGINWQLQKSIAQINKDSNNLDIHFTDDSSMLFDVVLVATGLKANIELAKQAGIETNKAIVVNQKLQTNISNIFALGDCAEVCGLFLPYVMPLMNSARALAKTLAGDEDVVKFPVMPVTVKTPSCAVVAAPPVDSNKGEWIIEQEEQGVTAKFFNHDKEMTGFALVGEHVSKKQTLMKLLPEMLI